MSDNELSLTYIDGIARGREEATEQLAAAQEREAQLREAQLREALEDLHRAAKRTREMRCFVGEMENADEALALPTDDTALRERLKAERERCAEFVSNMLEVNANRIANAIRNLGDE